LLATFWRLLFKSLALVVIHKR